MGWLAAFSCFPIHGGWLSCRCINLHEIFTYSLWFGECQVRWSLWWCPSCGVHLPFVFESLRILYCIPLLNFLRWQSCQLDRGREQIRHWLSSWCILPVYCCLSSASVCLFWSKDMVRVCSIWSLRLWWGCCGCAGAIAAAILDGHVALVGLE